jgi:hypothetical protein
MKSSLHGSMVDWLGAVAGGALSRHAWPIVGIGVELAMTMRQNGVNNDGRSRGEHKF